MSKNDINTFQDIVMQAREGVLNHAAMEELPKIGVRRVQRLLEDSQRMHFDSMPPKTDGSNRESIAQLWIKED